MGDDVADTHAKLCRLVAVPVGGEVIVRCDALRVVLDDHTRLLAEVARLTHMLYDESLAYKAAAKRADVDGAAALRDAADKVDRGGERGGWQDDAPFCGDTLPHEVADWLRAEAARIEAGHHG